MHDHAFHGGKFNDYVPKKPARTAGLVASAFMGLLLLPASKRSPVLTAIGLSWESTLWMYIALAVLFLFCACLRLSPRVSDGSPPSLRQRDNGRDDSSSASGASYVSASAEFATPTPVKSTSR